MYRLSVSTLTILLATLTPLQMAYADGLLADKPTQSQPTVVTVPATSVAMPTTCPTNIPMQAQVTATPISVLTAEQAQDRISITSSSLPLASNLRKSYEAYRVTIQSDYPNPLHLQSASVNNAQSGAMAYEMVRSNMTPVYCTLLLGLGGFILIGLSMMIVKNGHNEKTRQESLPYTNQISLIDLTQGQTITTNVLVPLGQKPDSSLNFKDRQTGLLISKRAI